MEAKYLVVLPCGAWCVVKVRDWNKYHGGFERITPKWKCVYIPSTQRLPEWPKTCVDYFRIETYS